MGRKRQKKSRRTQDKAERSLAQVETSDEPTVWPEGPWTGPQRSFALAYVTPGPDGQLPSGSQVVLKLNPGHSNPRQAASRWLAMPHVRAFIRQREHELVLDKRFTRAQAFDRYAALLEETAEEIERQKYAKFKGPPWIGNPVPAIQAQLKVLQEMLKLTGQDEPVKAKLEVSGDPNKPIKLQGVSSEVIRTIKRRVLGVERGA